MWNALVLAILLVLPVDDVLARIGALEAQNTGLRSRVSELETSAVRANRQRSQAELTGLVSRLDPGALTHLAAYRGGDSRLPALAQPLLSRLKDDASMGGMVQGKTDTISTFGNLLGDPTFATLPIGTPTLGTVYGTNISDANPQWPYWGASYVLNSGVAPATFRYITCNWNRHHIAAGFLTDNVSSSSTGELSVGWGASAGNITVYLVALDYANVTAGTRLPSWLTAGIDMVPFLFTNTTSATGYVEIVDATGATVYAQSDPEDLMNLDTLDLRSHMETALSGVAAGTSYYWRLRIDLAWPATAGAAAIAFSQPVFAWSEDGSAPPFMPAVGAWVPEVTRLRGASAYRTATQSIADATDTAVQFDTGNATEAWDTDAFHSLASSAAQFAVPFTGYYHVDAGVGWAANATGARDLWIEANADGVKRGQVRAINLNATQFYQTTGCDVYLFAGGYVRLMVRQSSGGALNVLGNDRTTFLDIHLVGV